MASFIDPRRVLSTSRTEAMVCLQRAPFVVYAICDPVTDLPVYVGQTQNIVSRFGSHMRCWTGDQRPQRHPSISRWLATLGSSPFIDRSTLSMPQPKVPDRRGRKLIKPDPWIASHLHLYSGLPLMPKLAILDRAETRQDVMARETDWIYRFADRGDKLFNLGPHKTRVRQAWKGFARHEIRDVKPKPSQADDPRADGTCCDLADGDGQTSA